MGQLLNQFGKPLAWSDFYQGAKHSHERTHVPVIVGDSDRTLTPFVRTTMLGISRMVTANVGLAAGAVADMARYSVGAGLKPQSQVADRKIAREYEQFFRDWEPVADATGKHTFGELQGLSSCAIDVDGDIGSAFIDNPIGQLLMVGGHRIASPHDAGTGWFDGVQVDKLGRRVGYMVKDGEKWRTYGANDFALISEPKRTDQVRGLTTLAHALNNIRDILDILGFEKTGVKIVTSIGVVIITEDGNVDLNQSLILDGNKASDTGEVAYETWRAGTIPRLKPGEQISSVAGGRQNSTFQGFLEFLIRDIAIGMGLPFEFVWDSAKVGGAGNRFILAKAARRFEQRQATIAKWNNRVWAWVIGRAIARKQLPPTPGFWRVRWQGPAKITVDVGREANANREDLKFGSRTLAMDAGEQGLDWQDDVRQQSEIELLDLYERADRIARDLKLPFRMVVDDLRRMSQAPASLEPLPTEEEETKPEPGKGKNDDEDRKDSK